MVLISDICMDYLPCSLGFDSKDHGKKREGWHPIKQAELEPRRCRYFMCGFNFLRHQKGLHSIKCVFLISPNIGRHFSIKRLKTSRIKWPFTCSGFSILSVLTELDIKPYWRAIIPGSDWQTVTAPLTHMMQTCEWRQEKCVKANACKPGKIRRIYTVA